MGKSVVVSSSAWQRVEIDAVCNHESEVIVSKRKFSRSAQCYIKTLEFNATEKSIDKLYDLLKHLKSECDEDSCKYCKRFKKEYGGN